MAARTDKVAIAAAVTEQEALDFHSARPARQARDHPDQADGDPARPVAGLFAGRRRAGQGHRRGSRGLRLHRARQHGRRHLQRHGHPRPRQSRRAGLQAGDGRQGGAVQALRRCRFHRPGGRHRDVDEFINACAYLGPSSAASIWRTSRRRTASSSSKRLREDGHSRSSTTTSTAPQSSPWPA
jgi:hypothetical protein